MSSGDDGGPGLAIAMTFVAIVAVFAAFAAISACIRRDAAAQQPSGGPQAAGTATSGEKDGEMVVVDGAQVAEAVVEIQGCCCGGGGGGGGDCGGDGGGCGGGCGGD